MIDITSESELQTQWAAIAQFFNIITAALFHYSDPLDGMDNPKEKV